MKLSFDRDKEQKAAPTQSGGHASAMDILPGRKRHRKRRDNMAMLADAKLGFRRDEVDFVFGSVQLVDEVIAAKWLVPCVNRHKLQIFDRGDVTRAWLRIRSGEQPPRLGN